MLEQINEPRNLQCPVVVQACIPEIAIGGQEVGPLVGCWSTQGPEYALELVLVVLSREQGATAVHFHHDAADGPHVDSSPVHRGSKQNIGRPVPQGDHFTGITRNGHS